MNEKEAYRKKLEARLDEWEARVDSLEAQASRIQADARLEYEQQVGELKKMRQSARDKLGELRDVGEDSWEQFRADLESSMTRMQESARVAMSRFDD